MLSSILSRPLEPDDERLWLVSFVGILVVAGVIGVVVFPLPEPTASFRVADVGEGVPVTVTVERLEPGGEYEPVAQTVVNENAATVYTTTVEGYYNVRVAGDGWRCDRRVRLERSGLTAERSLPELILWLGGWS